MKNCFKDWSQSTNQCNGVLSESELLVTSVIPYGVRVSNVRALSGTCTAYMRFQSVSADDLLSVFLRIE